MRRRVLKEEMCAITRRKTIALGKKILGRNLSRIDAANPKALELDWGKKFL